MRLTRSAVSAVLFAATFIVCVALAVPLAGAQEHGRKWQPPPPTAEVTVKVIKAFNGSPFPNAGVVFHAVRNGKSDGNLEVKSDLDGNAKIDVLEVGSHVLVQVIASGYATSATEFDLPADGKQLTVKLERPRAQVSQFVDNDGKVSQTKPGVQERVIPKSVPAPASSQSPATTAPPQ